MRSCEREPTASMTTSSLFIITRAFRMRLIYDLNRKRAYTQQLQIFCLCRVVENSDFTRREIF